MRNEHAKIWDQFYAAFPESPDFAGYLTGQVIVRKGTLRIAKLMVLQLQAFRKNSCHFGTIKQDTVNRFACEDQPYRVLHVSRALISNTMFTRELTAFQMSMKGRIDLRDKTFVHYTDVSDQARIQLENVFRCACAMLYGHKSQTPSHGFRL